MRKLLKFVQNNPKKSVIIPIISGAIGKWIHGKYSDSCFRKLQCENAQRFGEQIIQPLQETKRVTVFLNPAANNGKASDLFMKNAAPILHLAGLEVHVVKLEYEGQAKKLLAVLDKTDMIVAAGGDGTIHEVVTGLLRRPDCKQWKNIPIAVLPLGKNNTVCRRICKDGIFDRQAQWICSAAFNIIHAITRPVDVMKIEGEKGKFVYCLSDIQWGAYRDVQVKIDKYWYWGPLKAYIAYVFAWMRSRTLIPRNFILTYLEPQEIQKEVAEKDSNEINKQNAQTDSLVSSILHRLLPWTLWGSTTNEAEPVNLPETVEEIVEKNNNEIIVPNDENWNINEYETLEVLVSANTHKPLIEREKAAIKINIEKPFTTFSDFVTKGPFFLYHGKHSEIYPLESIEVSKFKFSPKPFLQKDEITYFSIDNEAYDAKPITVEILPNYINMVCSG